MNAEVTSGRQVETGAVRPGAEHRDQEVGSVVRVAGSGGCGESRAWRVAIVMRTAATGAFGTKWW
jgi:hypothetical protein